MADYVVAIPARYASTRLPGKPLADVAGEPMIRVVCTQALKSGAARVIACVDDVRVEEVLKGCGAEICMTSQECKCGTDRIAQMLTTMKLPDDTVVVNVQGDEPLINPDHIDQVAELLLSSGADMATLAAKITRVSDVFDPNLVKVVTDQKGIALYFSRAPIPYERDNFNSGKITELKYDHLHHIGIYAYRASTVLDYTKRAQAEIEKCESLEQLRLMHYGFKIAVGITKTPPEIGVDTAADLRRVNEILQRH